MKDEDKRAAMRALSDDQRRGMIEAAPNVSGYDRFQQRAKQIALRDAYRKPATPSDGAKA